MIIRFQLFLLVYYIVNTLGFPNLNHGRTNLFASVYDLKGLLFANTPHLGKWSAGGLDQLPCSEMGNFLKAETYTE